MAQVVSSSGGHSRKFSLGAKSNSSSGRKVDLTESHEEKARRNVTSKANPNMAMDELQPSMLYRSFELAQILTCDI